MNIVNASLKYLDISEGSRLYYQRWMPPSPDAVLIFVHGLTDHVGRYNALVQYFSTRNIGICLFDLRGHGNSSSRTIQKFHDYLHDIAQFIRFIKRDVGEVPLFLVGQSLGGQLVLNYIVRNAKGLTGAVVLSPLIETSFDIPSWRLKLGRLLSGVLPSYRVNLKVNPQDLTHDQEMADGYVKDPNICRTVTLKCGLEILQNAGLMMAMSSRIHLPLLLLHGGSDRICKASATKRFFIGLPGPHKELKIYPGLYHELLNETQKEMVFEDMEKWIRRQTAVEMPRKVVEYG